MGMQTCRIFSFSYFLIFFPLCCYFCHHDKYILQLLLWVSQRLKSNKSKCSFNYTSDNWTHISSTYLCESHFVHITFVQTNDPTATRNMLFFLNSGQQKIRKHFFHIFFFLITKRYIERVFCHFIAFSEKKSISFFEDNI